ncbi:MAG: DUF4340 domain-containing protein [Anaerolineales bacterium]|nr:DUF4340 domain-containing protein [Anaerolineales bacterium]
MKRSTAIVLVVFLALVGLMLYLNQKEPGTEEAAITPAAPIEFLFSDSDGLPTSIDIKSKTGEQTVLARNEAGAWVLKKPIEMEADQASAEAAASQITSLRIESRLEVAPEAAGLVPASYTLTVETTSGTKKTVRIGDLAPTGIGYYAVIDGNNETLIISRTGLDALLTLLESPPFVNELETSTP